MPASRPEASSNAPFPTTRWSQVVAAGGRAGPEARDAYRCIEIIEQAYRSAADGCRERPLAGPPGSIESDAT